MRTVSIVLIIKFLKNVSRELNIDRRILNNMLNKVLEESEEKKPTCSFIKKNGDLCQVVPKNGKEKCSKHSPRDRKKPLLVDVSPPSIPPGGCPPSSMKNRGDI